MSHEGDQVPRVLTARGFAANFPGVPEEEGLATLPPGHTVRSRLYLPLYWRFHFVF